MLQVSMIEFQNSATKSNTAHTLFWVGVQGGVYFFLASGGGLRVGTGFDPEGGYRVGTVSKNFFSKWP